MGDVEALVVGSRYRVRGDRAIASVAVGQPVVELSDGTTLELAKLDEHWDHTHAMILSTASIAAHFCVLDGPRTGATVRVTFREEVIPELDQHRRTGFPFWLVPIGPA